jgi:hypothetical protein
VFVADDENGKPVAHIAIARKPSRDIYYVRVTDGGTDIQLPVLIAAGQPNLSESSFQIFGRPSVVADKNRVQIAYYAGTIPGGRIHLAEFDDYGANFILASEINFVLPGTPVGRYEIQQPSLIVDGNGKSHLICIYNDESEVDPNITYQMLYTSWEPPYWVPYP